MDVDLATLSESAKAFVIGAQSYLSGKGYVFISNIQVHCQFASGAILNRKILVFPSTETARGFFYTFRDYVWINDTGTQRITVQLYNYHFQNELQDRSLRSIAARGLLPIEAAKISEGHGAAALPPPQLTNLSSNRHGGGSSWSCWPCL